MTGRALALAVLVTVALGAAVAYAGFSAVTSSTGNSFSAATLQPPSNLSVTHSCVVTGTIAHRASTSATGSGSLTISKPTGVASGDVLIAQVSQRASGATFTAPSGWTQVRSDTNAEVTQAIYWKAAGGSEPASYGWSSTSGGRTVGGISAFTGVSTNSPIDVHGGASGTAGTMAAPSVITTVADTRLLAFYGLRQSTMTLPAGMTARWNLNSAGGAGSVSAGAADQANAATGPTGARNATSGQAGFEWIAQLVALRPQASPYASVSWTATPSTFASGYRLERWRGGTLESTNVVTPRTQTSASDGPLSNATSYTYKLAAYVGNWRSTQITDTSTSNSC